MIELITVSWQTVTSYFLTGLSIVLVLLFALSCICIAMRMVNWPVFALAATAWGGLVLSSAFVWLCVTYYKPYFNWIYGVKTNVVAEPAKRFLPAMPVTTALAPGSIN